MECSERLKNIKPSATLAISSKAKQMKKEGIDIINFGAGEPDFGTPENIAAAGCNAIKEGFTRYTDASGIPELKLAICEKMKADSNVDAGPENVIVSCGAKHSLFNIFMAYLNPGDEVLLPSPYWLTYPAQIALAGGKTVFLPTNANNGFAPENIEAFITEKTRAIIVNSPGNPTGGVWPREVLEKVAKLAIEKNLLIISDECYEKLVYGEKHISIASLGKEVFEHTVVVNAVSKTYAMTGWRIGYSVGHPALIKTMSVFQSQVTSNPTSISQKAALEALKGSQEEVMGRVKAFDERRKEMFKTLNDIPGVKCIEPKGAFYCFPNVKKLFGKKFGKYSISGSVDLCQYLLAEAKVAIVPGVAFGADDYTRLSYACSLEEIKEGLLRISNAVSKLK